MPQRKGFIAPQNTFLDTIANRFDGTHSNFVLGNAQAKDHPIVYCSDGFVELSGYSRPQIMSRGCNCSFLWGEKTKMEAKDKITNALENKIELQTEVVFHRKNETTFPCLLDIVPIKNDKGQVVLFLVSYKNLSFEKQKAVKKISAILGAGVNSFKTKKNFSLSSRNDLSSLAAQHKGFLSAGLATTVAAAALVNSSLKDDPPSNNSDTSRSNLKVPNDRFHSANTSRRQSSTSLNEAKINKSLSYKALRARRHSALPANFQNQKETCSKLMTSSSGQMTPQNPLRAAKHNEIFNKSDETSLELAEKSGSDVENSDNHSNVDVNEEIIIVDEKETPHDQDDSGNSSNDEEEANSDDYDPEFDEPSTAYKFQRRRSRAVLYNLSGRFDPKPKRKMPLKKIHDFTGKDTIPEYRVQDVQPSKFILLHYSIWKIIWDWLILLCTFYIAIVVPYNFAFQENGIFPIDFCVGIFFILDVILNFLTTYVSKGGQVIFKPKQIAINYIKGWLFLDLIAAIPFDIVYFTFSDEGEDHKNRNRLNLMKLTRLVRLLRLYQKIERYTQHSAMVLGLLMCMFFLISHWFACGWYSLGVKEFNNITIRDHSWLYQLANRTSVNIEDDVTVISQESRYVSSLYFMTSSLTSVGFGNVSPNTTNEKIFSIFAMLIGALMHAAVFGNVTTIIQRMYARRSAYQMKHQDLKDFTQAHHIPKQLKQRMVEFFQAMWSINRGIDKQMIMAEFPEELRGEIALHLNRDMLSLNHFRTASPGCLKSIAAIINTRFATPGEFLVHRGDVIKYLYFVCSGSLEILDEESSVVALLGKFDLFGCDIDNGPPYGLSAYDVKSLTYCELQCIEIDLLMTKVLNLYCNFKKDFSSALHEDLSFNIREGYDPMQFGREERLIAINAKQLPAIKESDEYEDKTDESPILESSGQENCIRSLSRENTEEDFTLINLECQAPLGSRESLTFSQDFDQLSTTDDLRKSDDGSVVKLKFPESLVDQEDVNLSQQDTTFETLQNTNNRRSFLSGRSFSVDEGNKSQVNYSSISIRQNHSDNGNTTPNITTNNNNLLISSVNNWKRFVEINSWKRKLSLDKNYNLPHLAPEKRSDPWVIARQSPASTQTYSALQFVKQQQNDSLGQISSQKPVNMSQTCSSNTKAITRITREISSIHDEISEMRKQILLLSEGISSIRKTNQTILATISIPHSQNYQHHSQVTHQDSITVVNETSGRSSQAIPVNPNQTTTFVEVNKAVTFDIPSKTPSGSHQRTGSNNSSASVVPSQIKSSLKKRTKPLVNPNEYP